MGVLSMDLLKAYQWNELWTLPLYCFFRGITSGTRWLFHSLASVHHVFISCFIWELFLLLEHCCMYLCPYIFKPWSKLICTLTEYMSIWVLCSVLTMIVDSCLVEEQTVVQHYQLSVICELYWGNTGYYNSLYLNFSSHFWEVVGEFASQLDISSLL